jgi:hypothetical protein
MITRFRLAPDVAIIDCSMRGACSLVEKAADEFRNVKTVGIVSALHHCGECARRLTGTLRDPDDIAEDRSPNCADLVQRLLRKQLHYTSPATAS